MVFYIVTDNYIHFCYIQYVVCNYFEFEQLYCLVKGKKNHICTVIREKPFLSRFLSSSAADIYIKEFFHPFVLDGITDARPLRVLYRHRWIQTVSDTVLQYCIQEMDGPHAGSFRYGIYAFANEDLSPCQTEFVLKL